MFNVNTGFAPQVASNYYTETARRQSEQRRRTLLELLNASRERPSLSLPRAETFVNYAAQQSGGGGGGSVANARPARQNPKQSPQLEQRPEEEELLAAAPLPPQRFLQGNREGLSRRPGTDLNPAQVEQIQQWERNAANAEGRLRDRDRNLNVALANNPDQPFPERQVPAQRPILEDVGQPAGPELTLQQRIRMMGEQQAPTSLMLQELADERQRRANQPQRPGEIEITPGLPSLDSMRLYQRQLNDPMMSSEDKRIKLQRELQGDSLRLNQEQFERELGLRRAQEQNRVIDFEKEFGLRQAQEANRVFDAEEDRENRKKTVEQSNATSNRNAMLEFVSRMQGVDPDVQERINASIRKEFGANGEPIDPRDRATINMAREAVRQAQGGTVATTPEGQSVTNRSGGEALGQQVLRGTLTLQQAEALADEGDSNTVRGAKTMRESLLETLKKAAASQRTQKEKLTSPAAGYGFGSW